MGSLEILQNEGDIVMEILGKSTESQIIKQYGERTLKENQGAVELLNCGSTEGG